jgi:hypothetical protein
MSNVEVIITVQHLYRSFGCSVCGHTLRVPISCGNRFCPTCRSAINRNVRAKLDSLCNSISTQPGERFRLLTLSIKNQTDLKDQCRALLHAFRKLRQRQYWRKKIRGGAFVLEVKGCEGNWHIHIHAIVPAKWLSYKKLLYEWMEVSGGTGCHIKTIPKKDINFYLTKYITKSELPLRSQIHASEALKGCRLFNPFGCWVGLARVPITLACICPDCGNASWYATDQYIDPDTKRFLDGKTVWSTNNWMSAESNRLAEARGSPSYPF